MYLDRARRVSWIFVKRVKRVVEYRIVNVRVTAGGCQKGLGMQIKKGLLSIFISLHNSPLLLALGLGDSKL
jgi:hypothetical protein